MDNIVEVEGLLNYLGKSKNFFEEYETLKNTKMFCDEVNPKEYKFGLICYFKNIKEKALKVDLSPRSYFNMKYFLDVHTKYVSPTHNLFTSVCNFSDINIVAAVVPLYDNGHFVTFIIFEKDGQYLCSDCVLTDAICIMQVNEFPLYVHQDLVYKLGKDPKELWIGNA